MIANFIHHSFVEKSVLDIVYVGHQDTNTFALPDWAVICSVHSEHFVPNIDNKSLPCNLKEEATHRYLGEDVNEQVEDGDQKLRPASTEALLQVLRHGGHLEEAEKIQTTDGHQDQ